MFQLILLGLLLFCVSIIKIQGLSLGSSCRANLYANVSKAIAIHTYVKARGKVSPRKSVVQSNCYYDVTSRVSNFQNDEQSVHRRDG